MVEYADLRRSPPPTPRPAAPASHRRPAELRRNATPPSLSRIKPFRAALAARDTDPRSTSASSAHPSRRARASASPPAPPPQLAAILRGRYPTTGIAAGVGGRGLIGASANCGPVSWPTIPGASRRHQHRVETDTGSNHSTGRSTRRQSSPSHSPQASRRSTSLHARPQPATPPVASTASTTVAGDIGLDQLHHLHRDCLHRPAQREPSHRTTSTSRMATLAGAKFQVDGIHEYVGDEAKGIQVHNLGQGELVTLRTGSPTPSTTTSGSWATSSSPALNLDLLVIQDLVVNGAITPGRRPPTDQGRQRKRTCYSCGPPQQGLTCRSCPRHVRRVVGTEGDVPVRLLHYVDVLRDVG